LTLISPNYAWSNSDQIASKNNSNYDINNNYCYSNDNDSKINNNNKNKTQKIKNDTKQHEKLMGVERLNE